MSDKCSLVFDIGTSSVKAGLFFFSGKAPLIVRESLPIENAFSGEWSVDYWIKAIKLSVLKLKKLSPSSFSLIKGISVSGNGPSVVAVNPKNESCSPVLLWTQLSSGFRSESGSYFLNIFKLMKSKFRDSFDKAKWLLSSPEYISYRICGVPSVFIANESYKSLYWNKMDNDFDFCNSKLPLYSLTGSLLGSSTKEACDLFSIPEGISVYSGGIDYSMALYGSGAVIPNVICDRAGTSEGINYCSNISYKEQSKFLSVMPHPVNGFYNVSSILSSSGSLFEWYRNVFGLKSIEYNKMIENIYSLEPSLAPIFFPSLTSNGGKEFYSGSFVGIQPSFGSFEMGRGILQSLAFEVKSIVIDLEQSGYPIDDYIVCGGQARSSFWNQMKSDILGRTIKVPDVVDAELVGNHCAVLKGCGEFNTMESATKNVVSYTTYIHPNNERIKLYSDLYQRYKTLFSKALIVIEDLKL